MTGIAGSSVNFTWTFSGTLRTAVLIKQKDGSREAVISINYGLTVNTAAPYSGRVSVVWNGRSHGQVTFTLNLIRITDEGSYICILEPVHAGQAIPDDTVQLIVLGKRA